MKSPPNSVKLNAMKRDDEATLSDLKARIQRFCEARDWDQYHTPKDLAIGLVTEASELLEHFRFKSNEECLERIKHPTKGEEIRDELADAFFFILRLAQRFDIDLSSSLHAKMAKNEVKYPVETAKGSNKKYNDQ